MTKTMQISDSGQIWEPTMNLRFVTVFKNTYNSAGDANGRYKQKILQQEWVSHSGLKEWRDVPSE